MRRWPAIVAVMATVACGHSEPFASTAERHDGPFEASVPVRLTYAGLGDFDPGYSTDGRRITYVYETPQPDHDRCIGILPAVGGTRDAALCPWSLHNGGTSDGLGAAALRDDGAIAFTLHSGAIGNLTSTMMGLYLGQVDSIEGARKLLTLGERPLGASEPWLDLVAPTWIADDELLVLAARRFLVNSNSCGDPGSEHARDCDRTILRDTLPIGIEFARLRIGDAGATVLATMPAQDAIAWSLDRTNDQIRYIVQRPRPDLASVFHESLADTVFTVAVTGGTPIALYGTAGDDGAPLERLHGIASGNGRVFISRSWRSPTGATFIIPPGTQLFSDISELMADGSLRTIAPAIGWRWGSLRLSPDGRHLLAEAVERTTSDIYQIEVGP